MLCFLGVCVAGRLFVCRLGFSQQGDDGKCTLRLDLGRKSVAPLVACVPRSMKRKRNYGRRQLPEILHEICQPVEHMRVWFFGGHPFFGVGVQFKGNQKDNHSFGASPTETHTHILLEMLTKPQFAQWHIWPWGQVLQFARFKCSAKSMVCLDSL